MPTEPAPPVPEGADGPKLGDFVNLPVVLIPIKNDTIDSDRYGTSDIVVCDLWVYDTVKGEMSNPGEVFVFWAKVRRQLDSFVGTGTAVAGQVVKVGRGFELHPLPADIQAKVDQAFDAAEQAAVDAF